MSDPREVLTLRYDPEGPEDSEFSVSIPAEAVGFLATLTDFELEVFAAAATIAVRNALKLPPSPP